MESTATKRTKDIRLRQMRAQASRAVEMSERPDNAQMPKKHFIPTWDWFVVTDYGKKMLAENGAHFKIIMAAFKAGMDAVQQPEVIATWKP